MQPLGTDKINCLRDEWNLRRHPWYSLARIKHQTIGRASCWGLHCVPPWRDCWQKKVSFWNAFVSAINLPKDIGRRKPRSISNLTKAAPRDQNAIVFFVRTSGTLMLNFNSCFQPNSNSRTYIFTKGVVRVCGVCYFAPVALWEVPTAGGVGGSVQRTVSCIFFAVAESRLPLVYSIYNNSIVPLTFYITEGYCSREPGKYTPRSSNRSQQKYDNKILSAMRTQNWVVSQLARLQGDNSDPCDSCFDTAANRIDRGFREKSRDKDNRNKKVLDSTKRVEDTTVIIWAARRAIKIAQQPLELQIH